MTFGTDESSRTSDSKHLVVLVLTKGCSSQYVLYVFFYGAGSRSDSVETTLQDFQ